MNPIQANISISPSFRLPNHHNPWIIFWYLSFATGTFSSEYHHRSKCFTFIFKFRYISPYSPPLFLFLSPPLPPSLPLPLLSFLLSPTSLSSPLFPLPSPFPPSHLPFPFLSLPSLFTLYSLLYILYHLQILLA